MQTKVNRSGLTEVVAVLNFYPRAWAPEALPESIEVVVRCLLSRTSYEKAFVVDGAYPLVRLPGGLACRGAEPRIPKRAFRAALFEALSEKVKPDPIHKISYSSIDWEGGMLDE